MPLSVPQARILTIAAEGAIFRDAPGGGNWLYSFPGKPLMRPAAGVTCRALVKHGWLERHQTDTDPHAILYVISSDGRRELEVTGLKPSMETASVAPANIKF